MDWKQKEKEKQFLSCFFQYFSKIDNSFEKYAITSTSEAPDFIIEANKKIYAIEITEYFNGILQKNTGSIEKLEYSKKRKLLDNIQIAYERKCPIFLNVSIIWSEFDFTKLKNDEILLMSEIFSNKLVEIVQLDPPIKWAYNDLHSFVSENILSKYISWINVSFKTPMDDKKNFFSFTEGGYIEDPVPKIKQIISDKLLKLESYISNLNSQKIQYDKFILLIDADGRHISSAADFEKIKESFPSEIYSFEKPFKFTFDNIFIYDQSFKRFAQIK